MFLEVQNIKPNFLSDLSMSKSDVYLQQSLILEKKKKYLIKAHSGKGKSTFLNILYGRASDFEGKVIYHDVSNTDKNSLWNHHISYLHQDLKLFKELTAYDNIVLKNSISNFKSNDEIDALLEEFGLIDKRDVFIERMSLGQRQRVAIIRALCQPFDFLLMDEPFSHLDELNAKKITAVIDKELKEREASLVMTSLGNEYFFEFDAILNV